MDARARVLRDTEDSIPSGLAGGFGGGVVEDSLAGGVADGCGSAVCIGGVSGGGFAVRGGQTFPANHVLGLGDGLVVQLSGACGWGRRRTT